MDETPSTPSRPAGGRRRGQPRPQEPLEVPSPARGRRRAAAPPQETSPWLQDAADDSWLQEEADVPDTPLEEIQGVERIVRLGAPSEDHSPESTAGEDADHAAWAQSHPGAPSRPGTQSPPGAQSPPEAQSLPEDPDAPEDPRTQQPPREESVPAPAARKKPLRRREADPFRPELQGLRAVAILMVVCYHIWFGRVSGGVDIFLLISAFLLTGSFARKLEAGAPLRVVTYWIHAFKRLLPPATLVVLLTLGAIALLLPATRWRDLIDEALASGLYYENWLLAARSVDYYAADHSTASPFQHFWSLSIQGQVFLLWPLLFALTALVARVLGTGPRRVAILLLGALTLASFAWSVHLTATDQTLAYFDTRTRLWEFGLGSLLALVLPSIERRLRYRQVDGSNRWSGVRAVLGWLGLVLILSAGWVLDVEGGFPGYIALWPLLAAALVIVPGPTGRRWGVDRLLSSRPLQWLGDLSYSLYLVHWPLLILVLVATGTGTVGPWLGTGLVAASVLLAWLITLGLDSPIRTSRRLRERWWRGALVVAASIALIIGPSVGWAQVLEAQQERFAQQAAPADNPGARALAEDYVASGDPEAPTLPAAGSRSSDWASDDWSGWCSEEPALPQVGLEKLECAHLVAPEEPTRRVVAVGNSHTDQWMAAVELIAEEKDWDLVIVRRPACFFTSPQDNSTPECDAWLEQAESFLEQHDPDTILIQSTFTTRDGEDEIIREGTREQVARWTGEGRTVLGIRDNPRFATSHEDCELASGTGSCSFDHVAASTPDPTVPWEEELPGYGAVDMNDVICPGGSCPSITGNVFVYLDDDHVTATFARSAAPQLEARLEQAIGRTEDRRESLDAS